MFVMKNINKIRKRIIISIVIILLIGVGVAYKFLHKDNVNVPEYNEKKISKGVPREMSVKGKIREAEKLINNLQFSQASILLSLSLSQDPETLRPYELLGEIYLQTHDFEKLENLIKEINKKFPEESTSLILETRKLIAERKFKEVLTVLGNEDKDIPNDLMFYKAVLFALKNDHEKSREILRDLSKIPVDKNPSDIRNFKVEKGFVSDSFSQKVIGLLDVYDDFDEFADGKNPHLFALISKNLAENNEAVLAKEFASIGIKEDPEYIDAWVLRGYSEYLMQDYKNSLKDLYHSYELDPSRPETYYFLALALEKNGDLQESALFFEKSLEFDFDFSAEIRWKLIDIFIAEKKYERVAKLYKELAEEESDSNKFVSATYNLINILKNPKAAIEITETLLEKNPKDILSLNLNAWALIENNSLDEAEIVLEKALELDKTNPRTALNFGILYEAHGDYSLAREWYKKSYEHGKGDGFDDIVNLAADKFNNLVDKENPAKISPDDKRKPSSP